MKPIAVDCIVPIFNENNISDLIQKIVTVPLSHYELFITIVDDGSDPPIDASLLKGSHVNVIRHTHNRGNSSAIKTGLFSTSRDLIVVMDGDGQHNPIYLESLLDQLRECDLVIAYRDGWKNCGFFRMMANRFYCWLSSALLSVEVKDITSGFRAFRRLSLYKVFPLFPERFSCEITLTLMAYLSGRRVGYVPFIVRPRSGRSKIHPLRDGHRMLQMILKIGMLANPIKFFGILAFGMIIIGLAYFIWSSIKIQSLFLPNGAVVMMIVAFLLLVLGRVVDYAKMILILLIRDDRFLESR